MQLIAPFLAALDVVAFLLRWGPPIALVLIAALIYSLVHRR